MEEVLEFLAIEIDGIVYDGCKITRRELNKRFDLARKKCERAYEQYNKKIEAKSRCQQGLYEFIVK